MKKPIQTDDRYDKLEKANRYCGSIAKYRFLSTFLDNLNSSSGHETIIGEYAERLIQKYYWNLLKIKDLFAKDFNIELLKNLEKYPLDLDQSFLNYYKKIVAELRLQSLDYNLKGCNQYYIQKKKALFVDGLLFYEYTLTNANDSNSRFDRFTAFSIIDIYPNYCIKAKVVKRGISFLGVEAPYYFILGFKVAIRLCEFEKLAKILKVKEGFSQTIGYDKLMYFIGENQISLSELVQMKPDIFRLELKKSFPGETPEKLSTLLIKANELVSTKHIGWKTVLYLLLHMNNSVLKNQLPAEGEETFYSLNLNKGVYPFEKHPFSSCLVKHIPKFSDICGLFNISENKGDYLAHIIFRASVDNGTIFLKSSDYITDEDKKWIESYDKDFQENFAGRQIIVAGNDVYLRQNKTDTEFVLSKLMSRTNDNSFPQYSEFIENCIKTRGIHIDDPGKRSALIKAFDRKSSFVVYGPAGSGKSYFAKLLLEVLPEFKVCCIALTNPAVDNLRQKIGSKYAEFCTITKFLSKPEVYESDLLIIDECSTISTRDMRRILEISKAKFLLLLGDTYQIQSIDFGNWFGLLPYFLDKGSYINLDSQFRSGSEILKRLWKLVRENQGGIKEFLSAEEISHLLDNSIFDKKYEDEIVLCLNYDGIFGINNINKVLQSKNPGKAIYWKQYVFKVGDPILFIETRRFAKVFHNNLKGKIVDVEQNENCLFFKVCVFSTISALELEFSKITFYEYDNNGNTIVGFAVRKIGERDYDSDSEYDSHLPFQIAYAVSIHKAQGLEYESVKVVISNEVEEIITHNVFYTAITRAKSNLAIYWSVETEEKVLKSFEIYNSKSDAQKLKHYAEEFKILGQ